MSTKEENNLDKTSGNLPAGKYYVGDLSTILEVENWEYVLKQFRPYSTKVETHTGVMTDPSGVKLAIFRTMGGDGDFVDNNGNTYKITSGSIGIYPLGDDVSDFKMEIYEDIGCIHTMDKSFSCTYNESKGVVKFGTITINTKSS